VAEIQRQRQGTSPSGKVTTEYHIAAPSLTEARDAIPGDYLVVWEHQIERGLFYVEITRTF
jgi:hypothetical protein